MEAAVDRERLTAQTFMIPAALRTSGAQTFVFRGELSQMFRGVPNV